MQKNLFLKYSIIFITILVYLYGSIWLFNHVNAWLGIGIFLLGVISLGNKIFNNINSKKDA